ncbi:hypothetical protein A2943_01240 [Candidatus Adlerbacteria bacterium RIFCSPLOWO2_01_FULL_51_16]|uniref:PrgI family protein n=1 Tax=Candidatus Adlerbacteria bacterium RIFCSPLOWO2_01_FULL_51_16 TaxID=1797243 RepID=A0A1F4XF95_9BACT|nr:MAG: hypothetical protein A2943_01240 [Candidatus Adlerbacteria bacterium RIFCSPLOWO2_01_FULL_51_16]
MRYQVPQFIEVEDKIFGPLTLKQFVWLAGAGGLCLIFFTFLPFFVAIVFALPAAIFGAGLAFYQVNGRPLIIAIEHAFMYFIGNKLYLWQQRVPKAPEAQAEKPKTSTTLPVPKLSESRLKDLAWSLNIKDQAQMGVTEAQGRGFEI